MALLKDIALQDEAQTFRSAVIALARMCDPEAETALGEVRVRVRNVEHRQFAAAPMDELAPFKRCPPRAS